MSNKDALDTAQMMIKDTSQKRVEYTGKELSELYIIQDQALPQIMAELTKSLQQGQIMVKLPKPPLDSSYFEGELYEREGQRLRYRSLRAWTELTQVLEANFSIEAISDSFYDILLCKRELKPETWHKQALPSGNPEKYGQQSKYSRICKLEEPRQLNSLLKVAQLIKKQSLNKCLAIGCNQGDELLGLWLGLNEQQKASAQFTGLDHSASAIKAARLKYPTELYPQFNFEVADARCLDLAHYAQLDLLIALNILHSPALDGHQLFKSWVKNLLNPKATVVVGLPNCRYKGSQLQFGAVTKHRGEQQDMSLILSEVQFYSRYLRQQGFNVQVIGHYTFLIIGQR